MDLKNCNFVLVQLASPTGLPYQEMINHFQPGKITCARIIPLSCTRILF